MKSAVKFVISVDVAFVVADHIAFIQLAFYMSAFEHPWVEVFLFILSICVLLNTLIYRRHRWTNYVMSVQNTANFLHQIEWFSFFMAHISTSSFGHGQVLSSGGDLLKVVPPVFSSFCKEGRFGADRRINSAVHLSHQWNLHNCQCLWALLCITISLLWYSRMDHSSSGRTFICEDVVLLSIYRFHSHHLWFASPLATYWYRSPWVSTCGRVSRWSLWDRASAPGVHNCPHL